MKFTTTVISSLCLVLAGMGPAADAMAGKVVVVVASNSAVTSLKKDQLSNIFLGKTHLFPNGTHAIPYDQSEDSPKRSEFYATFLGRSPAQLKAHWAKIIFTGRGQPPKALPNDEAVKRAVASDPAAIGYIDEAFLDGTLRVISTD